MEKPDLTIEYLHEKEAEYRKMATTHHDMYFAAKGAADAIMLMLRDLDGSPGQELSGSSGKEVTP